METIVKTRVGAYGIIIKDERIALVKKARGGYLGKLDLPGGGMEHGEMPFKTLKRELMEETGVTVKNYTLLDVSAANIKWEMESDLWEDLHQVGILYEVETTDLELKEEADGLDSDGANWYNIKDLEKSSLTPLTIYSLEKLGYKLKD